MGTCGRQGCAADCGVVSFLSGILALNRFVSWRRARDCSVPSERKGGAGAGLRSASVSIMATSVALSSGDVAGIVMLWGKKATVRAMWSAQVFVM